MINKETLRYCISLVIGGRGRYLFSKCGKRLSVYGKLNVLQNESALISVGDYVKFWPSVKLSVYGDGTSKAKLTIGSESSIGDRTEIHCGKEITIGQHVLISWDCCILDRDYHCLNSSEEKKRSVIIEDNVWIGCRSLIMKGVTIGAGSVIAAGSVVTQSIPPKSLVAGNPAKIIRNGIEWK